MFCVIPDCDIAINGEGYHDRHEGGNIVIGGEDLIAIDRWRRDLDMTISREFAICDISREFVISQSAGNL